MTRDVPPMALHKDVHWYALYTRPRHERRVDQQLREKEIVSFLPMRKILKQWSDRKKWIEEPLFRCYLFIHADPSDRLRALQTYGIVRMVSFQGKPAVVQDKEIDIIQRIIDEDPGVEALSRFTIGDQVEVVSGPLRGLKGQLESIQNERRLIVTIPSIQQSLRFNIHGADLEVVH